MRAASLAIAALILLPFSLGEFWAYQLGLYFLYACAAIGIGICWGQAGFLPLGQAMFFGIAAYLSGFALIAFEGGTWSLPMLPLAAVASGAPRLFHREDWYFAAAARAAPISR